MNSLTTDLIRLIGMWEERRNRARERHAELLAEDGDPMTLAVMRAEQAGRRAAYNEVIRDIARMSGAVRGDQT